MSKFDAILSKISEALPVTPAQQPKPVTGTQPQQKTDPKIIQELIAAQNEQQVELALQKLRALQTTQQKPGTTQQPAV